MNGTLAAPRESEEAWRETASQEAALSDSKATGIATFEILVRPENLQEPDIRWRTWFLVFVSGFITGATADLFSLWLFAHWMNR